MATIGFKGFGWVLALATVTPACYMVSSMVAAERSRVEAVERAIVQAKRDLRALDTEFDTRSNFTQLERWNGDVLALAAPRPDQFVAGEAQLASLHQPVEQRAAVAMVVPSAPVAPIVQVADAEAVAVPQPAPARTVPQPVAAVSAPLAVDRPAQRVRAQKVAMLDRGLLSDSTLGDLMSSARGERTRAR